MTPTMFDEANVLLGPPEGEIGPNLPTWRGTLKSGDPVSVTCWEPTESELLEMIRTKKVWVLAWSHAHIPMQITGNKPLKQESGPLNAIVLPENSWSLPDMRPDAGGNLG